MSGFPKFGCPPGPLLFVACGLSVICECGIAAAEAADLSARGLLGRATGTSTCLEGDYHLTNPCTGSESALIDSQFSSVPFDPYLCQYVSASGPDVGIECPIIGVQSFVLVAPPSCIADLSVFDPASTWLQWPVRPCASSYDIIRGTLPGPAARAGGIDLGDVTCLVDDLVVAPGTTPSTLFGPRDAEAPSPGRIFFYLVRATLAPSGATPYGFSGAGEMEAPASGDCAP